MIIPVNVYSTETQFHASSTNLIFSERSKDRYIGNITLIAASLVSMYQLKRCLSPAISCGVSTITSALAGVALLAGEIVNIATHENVLKNLQYNEADLDEIREECISGDAGNEKINSASTNEKCSQLSALIAQRDAYRSLRRGLVTQVSLRVTAGVAYLVAMGIEIFAAIKKAASDSAVITAAIGAQATCVALAAGPQGIACGESVVRCEAALSGFQSYMAGKLMEFNDPLASPSMLSCTSIRSKHQAALNAVQLGCATGCCAGNVGPLLIKLGVETTTLNCMADFKNCDLGCQPPELMIVHHPINREIEMPSKKWFSSIINFIINPVYSKNETSINSVLQQIGSGLSLGVFGGAIIGGILGSEKYAGDTLFSTPVKRSIWYGAIGAIVATSSLQTQSAIEEVDGFISSLNNLIRVGGSELAAQTNVQQINSVADSGVGADFEDNADDEINYLDSIRDLNCPNGGNGKNGCLKVPEIIYSSLKEINLNGFAGVVSNLEDLSNEILDQKGSMKKVIQLTKEISGQKALVKKFVEEGKKKLLELNKANNVAAIDFEKEIEKTVDVLKSQALDKIKEKNPSFFSEGNIASTPTVIEQESKQELQKNMINKEMAAIEQSAIETPQIHFNFNADSIENNSNNQSEEEEERKQKVLTANALVDREKSIFQAITLRYQKTGYSALLEEY